jgi:hypothetical protein
MSQKRDAIDGGTVLGKGRLAELAAITGGTGVVGSMAVLQKSKARGRIDLLTVRFMPSYSRTALDIPDEISRSGKNLHRSGSDQSESLVVISRCAQAAARLVPPREIHGVRPDGGDGGRARDEGRYPRRSRIPAGQGFSVSRAW